VSALLVRMDALRDAGRDEDAARLSERWNWGPEDWETLRDTRVRWWNWTTEDWARAVINPVTRRRPPPLLVSQRTYAALVEMQAELQK